LIFGVKENYPQNKIVGSAFAEGREGELVQTVYREKRIRVKHEILKDDQDNRVNWLMRAF